MPRQLRFLPVYGLTILVAAALSVAQETKKTDKMPNFYPIEVGNTWHYKVNADGKDANVTTKIAKHENIDGQVLARLESPNVTLTEHLKQTDKGVFRYRFNGAEVMPPFELLPYPPTVGRKWKGEFTVQGEKGKNTYEGEIQKEEVVDVPAGKFKTLVVKIKLEGGGQQVDTTYWFVQDVGFVKQTFSVNGATVLLELEKFERKK